MTRFTQHYTALVFILIFILSALFIIMDVTNVKLQEVNPYSAISNIHHHLNLGAMVILTNVSRIPSISPMSTLDGYSFRNLSKIYQQYPIFASSKMSTGDSDVYYFMMKTLDIIDIKDGRIYFLIHGGLDFFMYTLVIPNIVIDEKMTQELHTIPERYDSLYSKNLAKRFIPSVSADYPCYRSLEGSYLTMDFLLDQYPDFVDVISIGPTYLKQTEKGGHDMQVLKMTNKNSNATSKAPLFITCSIHAREITPAELCARFAEDILDQYGTDADKTWILNYTEIHMIMQANPDGREDDELMFGRLGRGHYRRKNMHCDIRCPIDNGSIFGVDLNRNFPHFSWGTTGVGNRCSASYPGKSAGSEPETQNLVNYIQSVLPPNMNVMEDGKYTDESKGLLLDIHSFGEFFVFPLVFTEELSPNEVDLRALCLKMGSFTSPRYHCENNYPPSSGSLIDWVHDEFGIASLAVELGSAFYEGCFYFENLVWPNGMNILLNVARNAKHPYKFPRGPDVISLLLDSSTLSSNESLSATATVSDSSRALGYQTGNQSVTEIKIFIDMHPYESDSIPVLNLTNGNNSTNRIDRFEISMSSLVEGKHILYIQAYDTEGPGPVYATFFNIVNI